MSDLAVCAVLADGGVACWAEVHVGAEVGLNSPAETQRVALPGRARSIVGMTDDFAALLEDGSIWRWDVGRSGIPTAPVQWGAPRRSAAIYGSIRRLCALRSPTELRCAVAMTWAPSQETTVTPPARITAASRVAISDELICVANGPVLRCAEFGGTGSGASFGVGSTQRIDGLSVMGRTVCHTHGGSVFCHVVGVDRVEEILVAGLPDPASSVHVLFGWICATAGSDLFCAFPGTNEFDTLSATMHVVQRAVRTVARFGDSYAAAGQDGRIHVGRVARDGVVRPPRRRCRERDERTLGPDAAVDSRSPLTAVP